MPHCRFDAQNFAMLYFSLYLLHCRIAPMVTYERCTLITGHLFNYPWHPFFRLEDFATDPVHTLGNRYRSPSYQNVFTVIRSYPPLFVSELEYPRWTLLYFPPIFARFRRFRCAVVGQQFVVAKSDWRWASCDTWDSCHEENDSFDLEATLQDTSHEKRVDKRQAEWLMLAI